MSIARGYTDEQVREYVYAYARQPHGTRQQWLKEQGIGTHKFSRWRDAIFDGDLDRDLIPREGSPMTTPQQRRRLAAERDKTIANFAEEIDRLNARNRELEATNEALGKAIGLLHHLNEQEPDTPKMNKPPNS